MQANTIKSESMGGITGNPFEFRSGKTLKKIIIRAGSLIDAIQMGFSDGINFEYSPKFGGNGGTEYEWTVP